MFQIGEKYGDYEVIQILGAGGMGQVYKVRNTLSDRCEAMKVLLPNLEGHADLADRFLREIKVQATLQHKNIAGLHTAQRQGDRILMFIEFVDGITLDKALQRGPLGGDLAANIIGQVLEALAYAHARGVVHRDIKPENIMVQPDGTVKLMDFGIARLSQDRRLTGTGRTVGSLYYMSPEQIRGADDLDGRSDLYSLGVTLYQAVTGKRPFDGDSDYSIMSAHIQHTPIAPLELDSRVPAALNDVIMTAIAKDRNQRFQSAESFRTALMESVKPDAAGATKPHSTPLPPPPPVPPRPPVPTAVAPPLPPPPVPPRAATAAMTPGPIPTSVIPPAQYGPPPPAATKKSSNTGLWIGLSMFLVFGIGILAWKGEEWFPDEDHPKGETESTAKQQPETTPVSTTTPPPVTKTEPESTPPAAKKDDDDPPAQQPVTKRAEVARQPQQQPQSGYPVSTPPSTQVPQSQSPQVQQQQQAPVQQQQQAPARSSYQDPSQQQQRVPAVDPQTAREMEELRQRFNSLSTRFATAQDSVRSVEAAQQRQGLGMRRDIREAAGRFQYLMKEASDSIVGRNLDGARQSLQMAERNLERIEKFLGN
jgi:serine/threonine protein kinase